MDTFEVLASRKSVRTYTGEPPSGEQLDQVLSAAMCAPVVMADYHNVMIDVVSDPKVLARIDGAGRDLFGSPKMKSPLYRAPMLVVVSARIYPGRENAMYSSCAIIVHNMALAATELGLGSVCIWGSITAVAHRPHVLTMLQLPEGFFPCCGLALGQTDATFPRRDVDPNRIKVVRV